MFIYYTNGSSYAKSFLQNVSVL